MLNRVYKYITPWTEANPAQKTMNKCIGIVADYTYRLYCRAAKKKKSKTESDVVISLTTYPGRIDEVYYCLQSLLRQTVHPEKVVLWLANNQFPEGTSSVPKRILLLQNLGLDIQFCEDYKSYKKIYPAMKLWSDKVIVTADDDVLYPEDWLENLLKVSHEHPDCVVCYRAHEITFYKNNEPKPYMEWNGLSHNNKGPSDYLVPIGVGGVLYPAHFFKDTSFDYKIISRIGPTTDDIWLKVLGMMNGYKAVKVFTNSKEWITIHGSQKTSLVNINIDEMNRNDAAFKGFSEYYHLRVKEV